MDFEPFKGYDFEKNRPQGFALVLGSLGFIASFRLNSFLAFIIFTTSVGFIGYLLGYAAENLNKRIYRYPVYILLTSFLLVLSYWITFQIYQDCAGYFPYEATNMVTGLDKRFVGGCGRYGAHPWYYKK